MVKYKVKLKRLNGIFPGYHAFITGDDGQDLLFDNPAQAKRYATKMFSQSVGIDIMQVRSQQLRLRKTGARGRT